MERSKKVVFVSHCLLNQNVRPTNTEKSAGMVKELTDMLGEAGIGIIQLPCPQLAFNGGGVVRKFKTLEQCDSKKYRKYCKTLSSDIFLTIQKYIQSNYTVLGIIGVEFSPTCGVHQIEQSKKNSPGKGIMIQEIEEEMHKKNYQVPIIGVNLNNIYSSMEKIQNLLKYA